MAAYKPKLPIKHEKSNRKKERKVERSLVKHEDSDHTSESDSEVVGPPEFSVEIQPVKQSRNETRNGRVLSLKKSSSAAGSHSR